MKISEGKIKYAVFTFLALIFGILSTSFLFDFVGYKYHEKTEERVVQKQAENLWMEIEQEANVLSTENEKIAKNTTVSQRKEYFYFIKNTNTKPKISAEAYIVGDLNTGEIILGKNETKKLPIASVTKMMTALVASELDKEKNEVATVSQRALNTLGQNGNLKLKQKIKIQELLYPLLIESSNDGAEVIAEHFNRTEFMSKMNQQAKRIKMVNTVYNDPSGLSAKNISTTEDLFKLGGYLYQKKPEILKISKTKSYVTKTHKWFSHNQFLTKKGYVGGKSGFTIPAKQTVVSIFEMPLGKTGTRPVGIVLLRSNNRKQDVENIINYLNRNVYYGGKHDAVADWIQERLDIPDLREPDYITMILGGDIMLDRGVRSSVNKNFGGDYSLLFSKLEILKRPDIVFANLEGPASDKGVDRKNLYSFRMDPSVVPALKGAGISILSVANNHSGDWGREAFVDTLDRLNENEILYTGGGNLLEAENPTIIEKYGIKIGFLGFSDLGPEWLNATNENPGILLANNPRFEEIIQNASKQVDHLLVSIHFGEEYKTTNNQRQQNLARKAIDNGAKIVVGHHPHVIQNTEVYKNGYIIYSLGNFIFDQKFSQNTMQGMLLEAKLKMNGDLTVKKHTIKLNNVFQPDKLILGKEEKIKFQK